MNKFMYSKSIKATVEVLSRGHFPTTVIVKTSEGCKLEIDIDDLSAHSV